MKPGRTRDDDALRRGLTRWAAQHWPDQSDVRVNELVRPRTGWSNETLIVQCAIDGAPMRIVVRLPPLVPSFPVYDLDAQAAVLETLARGGVAAPSVVAIEHDPDVLGAPFVVMSFMDGEPGPDAPAFDEALLAMAPHHQRAQQERFLDALASVHRVAWQPGPLEHCLRQGVDEELAYWADYIGWAAFPDEPARALVDASQWCRDHQPATREELSLLWGDARLGNVLFAPSGAIVGLLDWELASIGPAEMDLAWYLVLDEMTNYFARTSVPGFFAHEDAVECYAAALGRPVADIAWHEIFALVRSIAITDRQARLAASAGVAYPGVAGDANPLLPLLQNRILNFPV